MSTSKTPQQRYYEKLVPDLPDRPGCIGWRAKIDKYGNASFSYTAEDGRKVSINAARWAWEAFRGPLPADYKVSNTCGLKFCQNLDHWELKPTNRGKSLWELYELKFTKAGPDECWPWQERSRDKDGYGIFSYRDPETKKAVTRRATRWAWERLYGSLPDDQMVCHTCDTPPCQNPRHWFLGPASVNNADKVAKGRDRAAAGEDHGHAKLTWDQVDEMRRLHASGEWTHQALADKFGIGRRAVSRIVNNERWVR